MNVFRSIDPKVLLFSRSIYLSRLNLIYRFLAAILEEWQLYSVTVLFGSHVDSALISDLFGLIRDFRLVFCWFFTSEVDFHSGFFIFKVIEISWTSQMKMHDWFRLVSNFQPAVQMKYLEMRQSVFEWSQTGIGGHYSLPKFSNVEMSLIRVVDVAH